MIVAVSMMLLGTVPGNTHGIAVPGSICWIVLYVVIVVGVVVVGLCRFSPLLIGARGGLSVGVASASRRGHEPIDMRVDTGRAGIL